MKTQSATAADEFEFAILGAGAIGTILGAHLTRAGHSVVMLARANRAQQIQRDGLRITGLAEFSTAVPTLCDATLLHRAQILIVAMKTPGTAEALASLRQARIGCAFSLQNGVVKDELLAQAFGRERLLGALADTSGEMQPDGTVAFTRNINILLGEISGQPSQRSSDLAAVIDASGVRASAVQNIQSLEWSKFVAWVGLMTMSVITRTYTWHFLTDPGSVTVLVRVMQEMGHLARELGIPLTDQAVLPTASICRESEQHAVASVMKVGRQFELNSPQHRMSSLQDFDAGRPLEIDETLGYAIRTANQLKLRLPLTDALYQLTGTLERLNRNPTLSDSQNQ